MGDAVSDSIGDSKSAVEVARVGRALAELVRSNDYRGAPLDPSGLLGPGPVVSVKQDLDVTGDIALGLQILEMLKGLPAERVSGIAQRTPAWESRQIGEKGFVIPGGVLAYLLPGELMESGVVLGFEAATTGFFTEPGSVTLHVRAEDIEDASTCLRSLVERASQHDPLRGRVVEFGSVDKGLPRVVERYAETLDDVVVSPEVRLELERNVLGHLHHAEVLKRSGLGAHRGVMLYGPPGTGKTSLVRAVVNAVGDGVTVLVPSMEAVAQSLSSVYQAAARLSPSIVVLEDIDVVTRDRRGGASASLMGFLNALDGVLVDRETVVVTIATSNNPDGMDDAAKRPGRIDRFIHVANPDDAAREMILEKNLRRLEEAGATVSVTKDCVSSIVAAAKGRSGAVLKEIVRRALLLGSATSAAVGDAELRAAALDVGIETASDPRHGTYL